MNQIFLWVLNRAWISSVLILAVLFVRVCIKKAPKWITCALWLVVALRLILPFQIESVFSLLPSSEPIPSNIEYQAVPQITSGVPIVNQVVNPVLEANLTPAAGASVNPMQIVISLAAVIWLIGICILCFYMGISYCLLRKKVSASQNLCENVYLCDEISSPLIFGVIRPKIYLPSGMPKETMECVLEHERAHLKRLDHLWKPMGFLILTVYWFHPLCWAAYVLLCKDIEFACDEKVTKDRDKEWKAAYCQALLDCNVNHRMVAVCPVAFGEGSVKGRIRSVLHYKKPAFWIIVLAIVLSSVVAVCFMTTSRSDTEEMQQTSERKETETISWTAKKWAQAFCEGDGEIIVSLASENVLSQFEEMQVLDREENPVWFSFGSSPMLTWPDEIIPYEIISTDAENHTADILYYVWTSDPHVVVWREQITLTPITSGYAVSEETLTVWDDISTMEEFLLAYPSGIKDTLMCYEKGNPFGETLNEHALSGNEHYQDLLKPETAVYDLLNIANKGNMRTEVIENGDPSSCNVRISFPDGVMEIIMHQPFGDNGIWVPYDYNVASASTKTELTMQGLVRMVTTNSWEQTLQEEGIAFWDSYSNVVEDAEFHKDSLTGIRQASLSYDTSQYELQVYYWPEDTAEEYGHSAGDLDDVTLCNVTTGDVLLLYSSDERFVPDTDIESFLVKKYELPQELLLGNECNALNGEVAFSGYHMELFLNFAGCLFENDQYEEPAHGEFAPQAWYSLGGTGVCEPSEYELFAVFENGLLTSYNYMDNHMGCELLQTFQAGDYSGCLYQYRMDLFTIPEAELLETEKPLESAYWVAFLTKGQGEPLYMKFFNCEYYTKEEAVQSTFESMKKMS